MINVLLILAGVAAIFMGITGRYKQVAAALVTGWRPTNAGTDGQSRTGGGGGGAGPYAV
jgi:hypothetical protein